MQKETTLQIIRYQMSHFENVATHDMIFFESMEIFIMMVIAANNIYPLHT